MVTSLLLYLTEVTLCVFYDMLAVQVALALNSLLKEQPSEELNPQGGMASPHEAEQWTVWADSCGDPVDLSSMQPVVVLLKATGPVILIAGEYGGADQVRDRHEILNSLAAQPQNQMTVNPLKQYLRYRRFRQSGAAEQSREETMRASPHPPKNPARMNKIGCPQLQCA
jgi:hypothetical protein